MSGKKDKSTWEAFTFVSGLGLTVVIEIAVGIFIGNFVDKYFDSTPIGTTVEIILGIVIGIWYKYKKIINY